LFWIEGGLAGIAVTLAAVTIVWRDWIEWIFRVDPDQHSGSAEWLIVAALLAAAVVLALLAVRQRHTTLAGRGAPESG
jgi:MYXO-CTERM domain-containing protein